MAHEFSKDQITEGIGTFPLTTITGYHVPTAASLMEEAIKAGMLESQGGIAGDTYDLVASGPYIVHAHDGYVFCEPYRVTTPQAAAGESS